MDRSALRFGSDSYTAQVVHLNYKSVFGIWFTGNGLMDDLRWHQMCVAQVLLHSHLVMCQITLLFPDWRCGRQDKLLECNLCYMETTGRKASSCWPRPISMQLNWQHQIWMRWTCSSFTEVPMYCQWSTHSQWWHWIQKCWTRYSNKLYKQFSASLVLASHLLVKLHLDQRTYVEWPYWIWVWNKASRVYNTLWILCTAKPLWET